MSQQQKYSIVSISLFAGWLLSFLFEGEVLYQLMNATAAEAEWIGLLAIGFHFVGLFSCGYFIKRSSSAKMVMMAGIAVCFAGSLIFLLPYSLLWYLSMIAMSYYAGLVIASWGYFFKWSTPRDRRLQTAADVLILSNLLMMMVNVITNHLSLYGGYALSSLLLLLAIPFIYRLDTEMEMDRSEPEMLDNPGIKETMEKPFLYLCVFIVIITINSGIMYQVVRPAFAHFRLLTAYYWVVPYLLALLILRSLPKGFNRALALYVALAMMGISYLLLMALEPTVKTYLLVNTFMLGAFGVFDLFWWSLIGDFLDSSRDAAKIMGIGLSMNVLGILLGGIAGSVITANTNQLDESILVALGVIFIVMVLMPILNNQLNRFFANHDFVMKLAGEIQSEEFVDPLQPFKKAYQLTDREGEIIDLLVQGYTYKGISEKLVVSENTIKFHSRNIYQKLQINNKMELIKLINQELKG
ncbi:regulatory protein, luxR family [Tindallia magadiensis]|uniref:Regulatory protein, luxR family n=1 Tax=Tindallia magadiensis TaxID=69895 RepID=A0A1I3HDA0_9FIRM|nr:helix-turn-helix transcriptional regulator [Tindallia magadiensis]SFI33540.1 regulatory protein, luxR family [Tindallia magadiensis]